MSKCVYKYIILVLNVKLSHLNLSNLLWNTLCQILSKNPLEIENKTNQLEILQLDVINLGMEKNFYSLAY